MEEENRKRMTECHGYSSEDKSLKRWAEVKSRRRVLKNFLIMIFCRYLPDSEFKNRIYRKTGMKIGKKVSIFGSNLDIFFPELISIGDNSIIGNMTAIITHEFLVDGYRKGPVKIGKNVTVGGMSLILPGVEIGDGATVAAYSLVNKNVEPGSVVGGVPIKKIK
jgi:acetyltransferase-like isoleucine patch superfamily enzyme